MTRDWRWWGEKPRRVTVVTDTAGWFDPFALRLVKRLNAAGDRARFARRHDEIEEGEVAFYLSCLKITPPEVLARNRLNLVAHASALPEGRGFSPLVWQVLEGKNTVPLRLIEATEPVNSGAIHAARDLKFRGHELNDEMRAALGHDIIDLCADFLAKPEPPPPPTAQTGEPTWYRRRAPADSRLDPGRPLADQFDLLRVVDNERYPAFFELRGRRYRLAITDDGPARDD